MAPTRNWNYILSDIKERHICVLRGPFLEVSDCGEHILLRLCVTSTRIGQSERIQRAASLLQPDTLCLMEKRTEPLKTILSGLILNFITSIQ